jgi:hypothetical protein
MGMQVPSDVDLKTIGKYVCSHEEIDSKLDQLKMSYREVTHGFQSALGGSPAYEVPALREVCPGAHCHEKATNFFLDIFNPLSILEHKFR